MKINIELADLQNNVRKMGIDPNKSPLDSQVQDTIKMTPKTTFRWVQNLKNFFIRKQSKPST